MKACISSRAVQECTATAAELAGQVCMEFEQQYEGKPVVMVDIPGAHESQSFAPSAE
jgi:hypothetical protein